MTIPGVDVSNYQRQIDWPTVAQAGIQFAIAKSSEGTGYADPYFPANWQGMKAAGVARAAYHFARPDINDAPSEASYFLSVVAAAGGLAQGDVLALDVEAGSGNLLAWVTGWLQAVEAAAGCKPLLYSSPSFLREHDLLGDATLSQYGLWLASWSTTPPTPPPSWPVWAVWQSSASGTVPGITGYVDLDQFNGSRDQFLAYGKPQPPAPKAPTNDDLEQLHRLVDAQPFSAANLISYAEPFK